MAPVTERLITFLVLPLNENNVENDKDVRINSVGRIQKYKYRESGAVVARRVNQEPPLTIRTQRLSHNFILKLLFDLDYHHPLFNISNNLSRITNINDRYNIKTKFLLLSL